MHSTQANRKKFLGLLFSLQHSFLDSIKKNQISFIFDVSCVFSSARQFLHVWSLSSVCWSIFDRFDKWYFHELRKLPISPHNIRSTIRIAFWVAVCSAASVAICFPTKFTAIVISYMSVMSIPCSFNIIVAYSTTLYPIECRATAIAFLSLCARLGGVFGSNLVGFLLYIECRSIFYMVAATLTSEFFNLSCFCVYVCAEMLMFLAGCAVIFCVWKIEWSERSGQGGTNWWQ